MPRKTLPPLKLVSIQPGQHQPDPPRDLGEPGRELWQSITSEFDIGDSEGRFLLEQACRALDRAESCRRAIDEAGELIGGRGQLRANPLLRDETACRALAIRTVQRLQLRLEAIKPVGRPSGGRG